MRTPLMIIGALAAFAVARSAGAWAELPPTMASHFGASGEPNGFVSRAGFFAFFGVVGGGVVALLLAIPWLVRTVPPSLINIPNRDYWLVPERLPQVHEKLFAWGGWFAAGIAAFLVAVLELVLRANLARAPLANGPLEVLLVLLLAGTVLSTAILIRSFRVPEA